MLSGRFPLRGLIALCRRLDLFVCNDSGAMHIAAACDTPLVAIWGPTDWRTTSPYHPEAIVVRNAEECEDAPCMLRECPNEEHCCMSSVSVEQVAEAVDQQMGRKR